MRIEGPESAVRASRLACNLGFRVQGLGFRVQGLGFRATFEKLMGRYFSESESR